jgi:hypothetical protein
MMKRIEFNIYQIRLIEVNYFSLPPSSSIFINILRLILLNTTQVKSLHSTCTYTCVKLGSFFFSFLPFLIFIFDRTEEKNFFFSACNIFFSSDCQQIMKREKKMRMCYILYIVQVDQAVFRIHSLIETFRI